MTKSNQDTSGITDTHAVLADEFANTQVNNLEVWLERKFDTQQRIYLRIILRDTIVRAINAAMSASGITGVGAGKKDLDLPEAKAESVNSTRQKESI